MQSEGAVGAEAARADAASGGRSAGWWLPQALGQVEGAGPKSLRHVHPSTRGPPEARGGHAGRLLTLQTCSREVRGRQRSAEPPWPRPWPKARLQLQGPLGLLRQLRRAKAALPHVSPWPLLLLVLLQRRLPPWQPRPRALGRAPVQRPQLLLPLLLPLGQCRWPASGVEWSCGAAGPHQRCRDMAICLHGWGHMATAASPSCLNSAAIDR